MKRPLKDKRPLGPLLYLDDKCNLTEKGSESVKNLKNSIEEGTDREKTISNSPFNKVSGSTSVLILEDSTSEYIKGNCILKLADPANFKFGKRELEKQVDVWNNSPDYITNHLAPIREYDLNEGWLLMEKADTNVSFEEFIDFVEDITDEGWYMKNMSLAEVGKIDREIVIIEYIFDIEEIKNEEDKKEIIEWTKDHRVTP